MTKARERNAISCFSAFVILYNMEIGVVISAMLLLEKIIGYQRGYIAEGSSIIGLILGLIAALAFRPTWLLLYVKEEPLPSVVGFLATFLLVYVVIAILAKLFEVFFRFYCFSVVKVLGRRPFLLLERYVVPERIYESL